MDEKLTKLIECFSLVFPEVDLEELPRLSVYSYPAWDSVGNILLTQVIEEKFNIIIKTEDIEELTSFGLILEHVNNNA